VKARTFTLREHDTLSYGELDPATVSGFERAVERLGIPALRFFRHHLKAGQYVGLLHSGRTSIQVIPKVYGDRDHDLGFLIFLLGYTRRLRIRATGQADLATLNGSFLEIWIRYFADELNTLLRQRFRREYSEIEEYTGFVRGKLLVHRMNHGLESMLGRYPCRYEIFTEDNPLNRILRYCNHLLRDQTGIPATAAVLRENEILLGDVATVPRTIRDVDGIHLNRLNRQYEPILELCRLLLRQSTVDIRAGALQQITILFDMNRLFEEFVAEFLRRHASLVQLGPEVTVGHVRQQKYLGRLFGEFPMYVDLVVTASDGRMILVDTKYKALDIQKRHRGLQQGDFYQMFGYARGGSDQHQEIVLLYPEGRSAEAQYQSGSVELRVRSVDLRSIWDVQTGRLKRRAAIEEFTRAFSASDS
jgi:5-methylcytosine-specific restriction enzyme subunit McrC